MPCKSRTPTLGVLGETLIKSPASCWLLVLTDIFISSSSSSSPPPFSRRVPLREPGPAQGFHLLKSRFFCRCCWKETTLIVADAVQIKLDGIFQFPDSHQLLILSLRHQRHKYQYHMNFGQSGKAGKHIRIHFLQELHESVLPRIS